MCQRQRRSLKYVLAISNTINAVLVYLKKVYNFYSFIFTKLSEYYNMDVNIQVYPHNNPWEHCIISHFTKYDEQMKKLKS